MIRLLKELTCEKAAGPSPSFSVVHVIKALELVSKGPIGRNRLSNGLALGEGTTRTLIARLKDYGIIVVERVGCVLTKKGEKLWNAWRAVFPRKKVVKRSGLTLAAFNVALLVKGCGDKVKFGMEQRDAALMIGARGATTLAFQGGKLAIPPDNRDVAKDFPEVSRELLDSLNPEEGDVIVIGSADGLDKAEYGALAAALTLFDNESVGTS